MHSNFYEVRISKIDPAVTHVPPGMQNMSKIMAKMSWGYQGSSTSQLVGSAVLGCTAAPAVPPARDLDFFISTGVSAVFDPWASGAAQEAHAGIAFYAPGFGYNKRQTVKSR
jgi:hypothetical protein